MYTFRQTSPGAAEKAARDNNMARRFAPSTKLTLFTALIVLATAGLAIWQFKRAEEKREWETAAMTAQSAAAQSVRADAPIHRFQRAVAIGRYQPSGQLLLDNRVHRRRAGYHVVTPLTLADGHAIMIKRGFLADDGHRNPVSPPPPSGIVTVNGWLYTDDREAFRLPGEKQETGTVRPRLDLSAYAEELGTPLLSLMLVQEIPMDNNLAAVSLRIDFKSAQSTGYAWQWMSFGALAVLFYLILGMRRP